MKIWHLDFELDQYDNLITKRKFELDEIRSFNGINKKKEWENLEVIRMEPEKKLPLSNAPGFYSHIPVFDKSVLEVLYSLIKNEVRNLVL